MLSILLGFSLLLAQFDGTKNVKVGRIFVNTPYNASIVFEYAFASIPEDRFLKDGAVDCFVSEMKATDLFTDVQVELKQIDGGQTVDVKITPTWVTGIEGFVIDEIAFEDFKGIDVAVLRQNLSQKGLSPGVYLLRYPLSTIEAMVKDAASEIHLGDPKKENRLNEKLFYLSSRVKVVSPSRVRLTITPGRKPLCQQ